MKANSANYQEVGTFNVVNSGPTQDFSVSMTPSTQSTTPGHTVQYSFTLTSINGFSGSVQLNATASPSDGITVTTPAGAFPSYFVPADGTVSGTLIVNTTASAPPAPIAITSTFQYANLQHSYSVQLALLAAAAPTITVSPGSGSGATQTFTIAVTDRGGYTAINALNFLINSSFSGANGCWFYLAPHAGIEHLSDWRPPPMASDDATNWSATTYVYSTDNSPTPIHNSQCSVFGGPTTISGSGDTLTLTLTLTFSPGFNGPKVIYVRERRTHRTRIPVISRKPPQLYPAHRARPTSVWAYRRAL